jgi:hypothetical protein
VWEDGRKLRWLTNAEIVQIEKGQLEVQSMFDESANREESSARVMEFPV